MQKDMENLSLLITVKMVSNVRKKSTRKTGEPKLKFWTIDFNRDCYLRLFNVLLSGVFRFFKKNIR